MQVKVDSDDVMFVQKWNASAKLDDNMTNDKLGSSSQYWC
jgi:hypothetical protein